MDADWSPLYGLLEAEDLDGYLLDADGADADQRYCSGFDAPDPFQTLVTATSRQLLVSELEYGRARETVDGTVRRHSEYDYQSLRREYGPQEARVRLIAAFLDDVGADAVAVPERFPVGTADGLREHGVSVTVDTEDTVGAVRARKTPAEVEHVGAAQRANEAAMATAESMLAAAQPEGDRLLLDGETLTSERVKRAIEATLLEHGCALDDTIVAAGAAGADPHDRGSGPIPPDSPVVVDIFPRDKETRYHADMTRTFLRGTPSPELERRYALTEEALAAATDAIEPGVTGEAVHDVVCDVYEDAGYPTLRSDPAATTGFIHGTGHGVGLEVHEAPRLSVGGGELEPGHVVTVEPGLYDPEVGGVRLEDLVVVTEDGHEVLTDYPLALKPSDRSAF